MVLSTLEVRWFFSGPLAETGPAVEAWFRSCAATGSGRPGPIHWNPPPPAWRQDRYLMVPGHDDLGIKWREGRLEIKGRESAPRRQVFSPGIEGTCERWIKWSYTGVTIERRFFGLFQDGDAPGIILVEKRRLQRYVPLDRATGPGEVSRDEPRQRGLELELVQIGIPGSSDGAYWSLAFEAFPGDANMSDRFAQVVADFLEGWPLLPLSAERSMSYPRWLLRFDQHTRISR